MTNNKTELLLAFGTLVCTIGGAICKGNVEKIDADKEAKKLTETIRKEIERSKSHSHH